MKQLLLQTIACCAILLPFSQADAKTFGGFKTGKTFSFKVVDKISSKATLGGVSKKSAVPAGIPDYKVGQRVRFTIGKGGKLTAKGMSMPFKQDAGTANVYFIPPSKSEPSGDIGQVYKTANNKPTGVSLSFFKAKGSGLSTAIHSVYYTLE